MTQERLREAVARALCELHIRTVRRHDTPPDELEAKLPGSVDYAWRDFIPQADAAIATMFERLRTPSEKALRAGCNKIDWERNPQEHMPTAPNGIVDLNSTFLTPGATTIGQDMLDAWQAMLTAFQQENSDAANN